MEVEASVVLVACTVDNCLLRPSRAAHGDCLAPEVYIPVAIARVGTWRDLHDVTISRRIYRFLDRGKVPRYFNRSRGRVQTHLDIIYQDINSPEFDVTGAPDRLDRDIMASWLQLPCR